MISPLELLVVILSKVLIWSIRFTDSKFYAYGVLSVLNAVILRTFPHLYITMDIVSIRNDIIGCLTLNPQSKSAKRITRLNIIESIMTANGIPFTPHGIDVSQANNAPAAVNLQYDLSAHCTKVLNSSGEIYWLSRHVAVIAFLETKVSSLKSMYLVFKGGAASGYHIKEQYGAVEYDIDTHFIKGGDNDTSIVLEGSDDERRVVCHAMIENSYNIFAGLVRFIESPSYRVVNSSVSFDQVYHFTKGSTKSFAIDTEVDLTNRVEVMNSAVKIYLSSSNHLYYSVMKLVGGTDKRRISFFLSRVMLNFRTKALQDKLIKGEILDVSISATDNHRMSATYVPVRYTYKNMLALLAHC